MDRTRQYFTLVYGVFDPAHGRFSYVMAGHPAPIVLPRIGPAAPLQGGGLPIGMIEHATFDDEAVTLQLGDRLYFYTDGVIEALNVAELLLRHGCETTLCGEGSTSSRTSSSAGRAVTWGTTRRCSRSSGPSEPLRNAASDRVRP